jgi:hypothetical protein
MEKKELMEAAYCGVAWLEDYYKRKKRYNAFHRLFKKLCENIIASEAGEVRFTLQDFAEDANGIQSSSAEGKAFSNICDSLQKAKSSIAELAVDKGFSVIPKLEMDDGSYMNVLTFSAIPAPKEDVVPKDTIPAGALRYTFDEKQSLWRIFGFMAGMKLSIWPFLIFGILFIVVGFLIAWWSSLLISHLIAQPTPGSFLLTFGTLFLIAALWRRYRAFDRFLTTKVALVHDVLARFSAPQSIAVLKNSDNDHPTIEIISASAICPICEGEIRLRKPHFKCSHEVIGACRNNPTQHCYSFDYVTRFGWPITDVARQHSNSKEASSK